MKTMKLIYPLAFALAIALASTGCKHEPVDVTKIPGTGAAVVGNENNNQTLPPGNPLQTEPNPNEFPGPIGTSSNWDPANYSPDPSALAAYTIHFAFDSAVIRDSEQANLQAVASALTADPNAKLLIQGNCDERGTEEYNRALGERRALAAREALAKLGIDPMRVRTISFGKDHPVDSGHNEAAWQQNRRDDFVLLHPKATM